MSTNTPVPRGRHFLQIPGPSNTPERVLKAIARPTIDHRGPEFGAMIKRILPQLQRVFQTDGQVIIYPSSGTGAWEAALTNLFSPGDRILAFETGFFAAKWKNVAASLGLDVQWEPGDWRRGVVAGKLEELLRADRKGQIKGVMIVHCETSIGVTTVLPPIRKAIDRVGHPAILLVDVVSSLVTTEFRQDDWGIDVAISASQKGLMLPPGLGFNAINKKAQSVAKENRHPRSYWRWEQIAEKNEDGFFPYTPASNLLLGLEESLKMIFEEGLSAIHARHRRYSEATMAAAATWELENQALNIAEFSNTTTALRVPDGFDADDLRAAILKYFNVSLGTGLGQLKGKVFRIGHLGDFNYTMLVGVLGAVEMGLKLQGIPHHPRGVQAAMDILSVNLS